jgi:hypothetical protein
MLSFDPTADCHFFDKVALLDEIGIDMNRFKRLF